MLGKRGWQHQPRVGHRMLVIEDHIEPATQPPDPSLSYPANLNVSISNVLAFSDRNRPSGRPTAM